MGSYFLADYVAGVRERLAEVDSSQEISESALSNSVSFGVRYHSEQVPLFEVEDILADGTFTLAMPAKWAPGFSRLVAVEYPLGSRRPSYLDLRHITIYTDPLAGDSLRLLETTPAVGSIVRVTYTRPHEITETSTTLPDDDYWPVVCVSAAMAARALAARYARTWDPSLSADVVNYRIRTDDYLALARECELIWRRHVGMREDGREAPALTHGAWNEAHPWPDPTIWTNRRI